MGKRRGTAAKRNAEPRVELFGPGDDWQNNACVNFTPDATELYTSGYRMAADKLVELVMSEPGEQDFLVYPVVFLYRQWLELRLKCLIATTSQLLDQEAKWPTTHKLQPLWDTARSGVTKTRLGVPEEDLRFVSAFIREYSAIDPESTAFRYPTSAAGDSSLPGTLTHINLRQLLDVVNRAAAILDAADGYASYHLQLKGEMDAEFGEPPESQDTAWWC